MNLDPRRQNQHVQNDESTNPTQSKQSEVVPPNNNNTDDSTHTSDSNNQTISTLMIMTPERSQSIKDMKSAWERNPWYREQSCKWERIVEEELTARLEREIHTKYGGQPERYKEKITLAKTNIYTLHGFQECTMLFMQKKIDVSKVSVNNQKFKKTCIKLEEKMRK